MNNNEIIQIKNLLKKINRTDLESKLLYDRSYNTVVEILSMPEWKDLKFRSLLTSNIWQTNVKEIKEILGISEWKEAKFHSLLTSAIWKSNAKEIKEILSMSEWKEEKFQPLLTSTIWRNNSRTILEKLNLDYWNNPLYTHLLSASIFNIKTHNIITGIELFEEYNINKYITNRCLRRNVNQQRCLIEYMIENDIALVVESNNGKNKLNPILNCSNTELKQKYNIDIKEITKVKEKGKTK